MEVILLEDVKSQGRRGDVVNVAEGYARNYLFPRKLATPASEGKLKNLATQKQHKRVKKEKALQAAKNQASKLEGQVIRLTTKSGEEGRLFGSVTTKEIAEVLQQDFKLVIDKRKLEIKENIKTLGTYPVVAKLYPGVQAVFSVQVLPE
jgi:large subunit ribosomal protein L9